MIRNKILEELYSGADPFDYADMSLVDHGYPHTNIVESSIDEILELTKPKFWLEIGSMLGDSAMKVANRIKILGMDTEIVCVDPFTGDVNMWCWEKSIDWKFIGIKNGKSSIYERFLANVKEQNHHDIIIPIPCTAVVGLGVLERLKKEERIDELPEVIYLDSSHEPQETFLELCRCWSVLKDDGVLWGDDWEWVKKDVELFAQKINKYIKTTDNHWFIKKD
jgi:hypothetical protein